jgi:aspartyl protease family protein
MTVRPQSDKSLSQRLGNGMIVIAWIILLGMLTLIFGNYLQQQHNPNANAVTGSYPDYTEIILQQNRFGHYVANGKINGSRVEFLLDTGATLISIPESLAQKLSLQHGPGIGVETANGSIIVYATLLEQVELGHIVLHNVRAGINPRMDSDKVLLGMNFLKHLELIQQRKTLTIRQYRNR